MAPTYRSTHGSFDESGSSAGAFAERRGHAAGSDFLSFLHKREVQQASSSGRAVQWGFLAGVGLFGAIAGYLLAELRSSAGTSGIEVYGGFAGICLAVLAFERLATLSRLGSEGRRLDRQFERMSAEFDAKWDEVATRHGLTLPEGPVSAGPQDSPKPDERQGTSARY